MDKEAVIEILGGWNFWTRDQEVGHRRKEYLKRLEALVSTRQVVAVTGVRRSGKSTLLKQFIKAHMEAGTNRKNFLYVNFEEPKFAGLLSLEFLQTIYEAYLEIVAPEGTPFIILDEVQNVRGWERFARSLHEKKEAQVIVSGSTSNLLGREVGQLLTGRWVELRVYPLNFPELLDFRSVRAGEKLEQLSRKVEIKRLLREFLENGGFPLVVLQEEKQEILRRYLEDILSRDVAERNRMRRPHKLKALAAYYLTNFSSHHSYRRIAKFIGLSLDSVERFSHYMEEAGLLFFVPKFSQSLKEQQVNPKVVYCIDSGLVNISNYKFGENVGKLYENAVFLSLQGTDSQVYYFKDRHECDFIVKKGGRAALAVQVCYDLANAGEREENGLLEAMEALKLKTGIIISDDAEGTKKINGKNIRYVPLWKWLLSDKNFQ